MTPEARNRTDQIRHGNVPEGYKETRMGIVPCDWVEVCLGDIYTERKEQGNENLPLLMVSIHTGVSDGEVDEDDLPKKVKRIEDKSQYKRAATGDLVFNMMRAWQGAIGTVRTEGMVSPAYIVARPNDKVYPLFMDYYMKTPRMVGVINRQSYGVTDFRKRLYWDSFAPIPCVLPPVREQQKIAEILSTQDRVIALQGRKIEELKRFKKGCMEKMFPRKGQRVPEKRFPGFTGNWEQRKFEDIAARSSTISSDCGLPRVEYEDIISGTGCLNKDVFAKGSDKAGIVFHKGDVLYGKLRPYLQNWLLPSFSGLAVGDFWVLHPQSAGSSFLYRLIQSRQFDEVANQSTGTKMPRADWKLVSKTGFFVPSTVEEQSDIGTYFEQLDNLITLHQRKLDEMHKQKKALMQLLLTGIVRVKT